jgi:poly(A) polymerase/tRNA nucleotidyltransferase (CCA-adding enzyme)
MTIPNQVKSIVEKLRENGYEAYIVGGCVRDILRGVKPKDWDIATNAKPEEIGKIFLRSYTNNDFGTVTVQTQKTKSKKQKPEIMEIEITPYRIDEKYTDKRHPDKIKWAKTIKQDLGRRDFTVNALATENGLKIIDLFDGQKDIKNKIIRAVGNAEKRFSEDALRLMRAVRFATTLDSEKVWEIEKETKKAIQKNAHLLSFISKERIRDELMKIIMSLNGAQGIETLRRLGLLKYIIPELEQGFGIEQNKHHIYQVYQHNLLSLNYACQKDFSKHVRLAALLHDIAKPRTKEGEGLDSTFYNHEIVGAKMTIQILQNLRFSKKDIEKIVRLVRYHLFYYNVGEVGEASIRRLIREVGPENMEELLQLRMCDRIGSAVPKAEPYKLRHLRYLIEKVSQDPISVKMLKVKGEDVINVLKISPGPQIGQILDILLSSVLNEPQKNKKEELKKEIKKLGSLNNKELQKTAQTAREEIRKIETKRDEMTKKKYWITPRSIKNRVDTIFTHCF